MYENTEFHEGGFRPRKASDISYNHPNFFIIFYSVCCYGHLCTQASFWVWVTWLFVRLLFVTLFLYMTRTTCFSIRAVYRNVFRGTQKYLKKIGELQGNDLFHLIREFFVWKVFDSFIPFDWKCFNRSPVPNSFLVRNVSRKDFGTVKTGCQWLNLLCTRNLSFNETMSVDTYIIFINMFCSWQMLLPASKQNNFWIRWISRYHAF